MRACLIALSLLAAGCAGASAQQAPDPAPVWRMHTEHFDEDRERARRCLSESARGCDDEIQEACAGGDGAEGNTNAAVRACNWRAIAAWEDEMDSLLEQLRQRLDGRNLENLEASQRAWEASMQADTRAVMDLYEGGSLSGLAGAHVRAHATSQRARYLADLLMMAGE
jgi:uncharacterized protein YecT (DUF1311 family)